MTAYLLEQGADVSVRTAKGNSALMYCAAAGNTEMLEHLSRKGGADGLTGMWNDNGDTPLMFAAMGGHYRAVNYLLAAGAPAEHTNKVRSRVRRSLTLAQRPNSPTGVACHIDRRG